MFSAASLNCDPMAGRSGSRGSEPLMKLAENLAMDAVEGKLRSFLEPSQLGALTSNGCAIAVRVLTRQGPVKPDKLRTEAHQEKYGKTLRQ